jgi:hypothetical protein
MVAQTVDQVQAILDERFSLSGDAQIDPDTLVVDVHGSVRMKSHAPEFGVQFGEVYGDFFCWNMTLKSLKGAPHRVGRDFNCESNLLTSLEHAPVHVTGSFSCAYNAGLRSLAHAPSHVGANFNCARCGLTSLLGAPDTIDGWFDCSHNQLTTLDHAPKQVTDLFDCSNNPLKSMKGAPNNMGSIELTYDEHLPLLRCLNAQLGINFIGGDTYPPREVQNLLERYMGSDKAGMLKCAGEMIRAGFKENARW